MDFAKDFTTNFTKDFTQDFTKDFTKIFLSILLWILERILHMVLLRTLPPKHFTEDSTGFYPPKGTAKAVPERVHLTVFQF